MNTSNMGDSDWEQLNRHWQTTASSLPQPGIEAPQVSEHQLKFVVVSHMSNWLNIKQSISEKVMYADWTQPGKLSQTKLSLSENYNPFCHPEKCEKVVNGPWAFIFIHHHYFKVAV